MPRSTLPLRLLAGVLALLALLLFPSIADAHTALKASDPAKDSRLSTAPTRITLWFTARPQLPFSRIRLIGPNGEVTLDKLVADTGMGFHADIRGAITPGTYRVEWQTASADGHPIRGDFAFSIAGTGASSVVATPSVADSTATASHHTPQPEAHAEHSEYHSVRWMEFVALLTVLGALGFRHGVLPPLAARGVPTAEAADRARQLGSSILILYVVSALVRLYTESVAVHGAADAMNPAQLRPMITSTTWGIGWLFGVIGSILLAIGWTVSRKSVTVGTPLALTGALGMALSPALSGHAAASQHFVANVVLDVMHVLAAGVWLGGLLMVLIAGIPAMRRLPNGNQDAAVSALVNSFHPLALFCAPIVVIMGAGTALLRLGSVGALWSTTYGQTLLWKVAWVALVAGMGFYNAVRTRHALGAAAGTRRIRRTGTLELLFAAVVIAVTTVLVTTPVPSEMVSP
ncbi:MAG TPA: copper resistance protein CopC [Gemmatimonadaceae bacterium]|nr:copper resistance protein CopC [Gemmatimonadaceae bacterium]